MATEQSEDTVTYHSPTGADECVVARGPYIVVALNCLKPQSTPIRVSLARAHRLDFDRGPNRVFRRSLEDGKRITRVRLVDKTMSTGHASIVATGSGYQLLDHGSKNGTSLNGEPIETTVPLLDGDLIGVGCTFILFRSAEETYLDEPGDFAFEADELFATANPKFARALYRLEAAATSNLPIFVSGQAGSARRELAAWIHARSLRTGAFVELDCATLIDQFGVLHAARGGTVYFSNIERLNEPAAELLFRVLEQNRESNPAGVRFVSSGPVDEVASFSPDLRRELVGLEFAIPPLSHRPEDIGWLVAKALRKNDAPAALRLERPAGRALLRYDWPRNEVELDEAVRTAASFAKNGAIDLEDLPSEVRESENQLRSRRRLVASLRSEQGNVTAVGRKLGISRIHVHRLCAKFGLDPDVFRAGRPTL